MVRWVSGHKITSFYVFAFAVSWPAWFVMSLFYEGGIPGPVVFVFSTLGALGPLASLLILQKVTKREVDLKRILGNIRIRNVSRKWFFPAIFALPIATVLGSIGYYWLGREEQLRLVKAGPDEFGMLVLLLMAVHFAASLVTSPLFEEPGWRGFALVHLQERYGRTPGSLVVGVMWWIWHQPMNIVFGILPSVYLFLSMVVLSFTIDSLFNLSGRNLLTAMLTHQSAGTAIVFLYQGQENWLQLSLLATFAGFLRIVEHRRDGQIIRASESV